jgi:hypothetical protein
MSVSGLEAGNTTDQYRETAMVAYRGTIIALVAAFLPLTVWSAPPDREHLDRPEMRRIVRKIEEKTDELQDHVDEWIGARPERARQVNEFNQVTERFETDLSNFKIQLINHDEPWDLRDQAERMIGSAQEVGRVISHGQFSPEMRRSWDDMRDQVNELARRYHLPEIGHD